MLENRRDVGRKGTSEREKETASKAFAATFDPVGKIPLP